MQHTGSLNPPRRIGGLQTTKHLQGSFVKHPGGHSHRESPGFLGLAELIQLFEKHLGADESVTSKVKPVSCLWVGTVCVLQERFRSFRPLIPTENNDSQQGLGVHQTLTYRELVASKSNKGLKPDRQGLDYLAREGELPQQSTSKEDT